MIRIKSGLLPVLIAIAFFGAAFHPAQAQASYFQDFIGDQLNAYWWGTLSYPTCAGQWFNSNSAFGNYNPGGCEGGGYGVFINSSKSLTLPVDTTLIDIRVHLHKTITPFIFTTIGAGRLIININHSGTNIVDQDTQVDQSWITATINASTDLNYVEVLWEENQACYELVPDYCPQIDDVQWDYTEATTPAPGTPTALSTVPTYTTQTPFAATGTIPPPVGTFASGPLATIQSLEQCSGDPFNPCGTMPYSLVMLPTIALPSPTPLPTIPTSTPIPITVTPSSTATPTPSPTLNGSVTATLTPSITPIFGGISFDPGQQLQTLVSQNFATLAPLGDYSQNWTINGTPVGLPGLANQLGGLAGQGLGFFTAIQGFQLGTAGNFVTIGFFILVLVIIVSVITAVLPMILAFVRFLLKAITALKIPFAG